MDAGDLILVSVDDHLIEPPDMFEGRLPARYQDEAPRVVRTDTGSDVRYDPAAKPGISNLLTIMSVLTEQPVADLEESYAGKGYGAFKTDLADAVVAFTTPLRACRRVA